MSKKLNKTPQQLKQDWEDAANHKQYRNFVAQGFTKEKAFREVGKKSTVHLLDTLKAHTITLRGKRIVEIGCGVGRMTEFLAKETGFIYATDISMNMLRRFRERLGDLPNVVLLCTPYIHMIPDNSIDAIISLFVFQHNPEDLVEKFFADRARALKHGGYFVFQLSVVPEHQVVISKGMRATDMVRWTQKELEKIAKKYNYEPLTSYNQHFKIWRVHK